MKPDVSNMTLEIIEAIKNKETVVFEYGKQELRNIKPEGFFGDYDGFQGTDIQLNQFRRFKFSEVTDWIGVKPTVMKEFTITVPCTIHYKVVEAQCPKASKNLGDYINKVRIIRDYKFKISYDVINNSISNVEFSRSLPSNLQRAMIKYLNSFTIYGDTTGCNVSIKILEN